MDRPVTIGHVHNMSWESFSDESNESPHLVALFSCETEVCECVHFHLFQISHHNFQVCCAAVWLHDVYNVTVKGISITVQKTNDQISVFILKNVSGITVQLNATCFTHHKTFGITICEATSVKVDSSSANNCSLGLVLHNSTNTHITKVTVMYNRIMGMALDTTTDTHIDNTIAAHNAWHGMDLSFLTYTYMSNTTAVHNHQNGIKLYKMTNTYMTNMTASHNGRDGMSATNVTNTYMSNMTTAQNIGWGMSLMYLNNTNITNMTATQNGRNGIFLFSGNNTCMTNTTATQNAMAYSNVIYYGQIAIVDSTATLLYNTSFTDASAQTVSGTEDPTSLPAVIVLHHSTLLVSGCEFTRNSISAMAAYASNITVSGDLTFYNNTAVAGTAFILIQNSILNSAENSHIYFLNNHATNTGGVFFYF